MEIRIIEVLLYLVVNKIIITCTSDLYVHSSIFLEFL